MVFLFSCNIQWVTIQKVNLSGKEVSRIMFKVFVGYDRREPIAYEVCVHSIKERLSEKSRKLITIHPLNQEHMRSLGIYERPVDVMASTEFTYSRFWCPYLMDYKGYSLFIDCDFLVNCDIMEMFETAIDLFKSNSEYVVALCKHDYTPKPGNKMDNKIQVTYPRKNWASAMVFNNSHPICRRLNLENLNNPANDGRYFLGFRWLGDTPHYLDDEKNMLEGERRIASLPLDFNWLSGEYREGEYLAEGRTLPRIIHYTLGGPWFYDEKCWNYPYVDLWLKEVKKLIGRDWTRKDTVDYPG